MKFNSRYRPSGSRFQVPILTGYPGSTRQHCNCQIPFIIQDFSALCNLILCPVRKAQGQNCVLPQLSTALPNALHPAAGCSTIAKASHVCSSPSTGVVLQLCMCTEQRSVAGTATRHVQNGMGDLFLWDTALQNPYNCFVLNQVPISFRAKFDLAVLQ